MPLTPRRRLRALAAAGAATAVCLTLPLAAEAATVSVRPDPDSAYEDDGPGGSPTRDEVHYVAGAGERNRLLVAYAGDALSVTVTDPGATIAAGESCTALDAHTVRCVPRRGAAAPFLQSVRAELGDLDDEVSTTRPGPAPIGGVVADGGPGDDRLDGGAGPDRLDGGGGRDVLLGGADFDVLTDGDRDGAGDDAGPGPDELDGGDGNDEVSYAQRTAPVRVTLPGEDAGGEAGEGDVLRGFENATGGAGADRLVGDGRPNRLLGGRGADVLIAKGGAGDGDIGDRLEGGAGRDRLSGGRGPDAIAGGSGRDAPDCGSGRDVVDGPQGGEALGRGCEVVRFAFGENREDSLTFAPHTRRADRTSVTFRLRCPDLEARDGEPVSCRGPLTLREAGGARRVLGRGTVAGGATGRPFDVRVALTELGRRRAGRRRGALATARIRGRNLPAVGWTVRAATSTGDGP